MGEYRSGRYDGGMIASIRGTVTGVSKSSLIIDVGGVGYRIYTTEATALSYSVGSPAELSTYLAVRENALDLFGFENTAELSFFELLLEVPGIGPRSALNILSIADIRTLREAIASKNAGYLTRVSGIGKKSAEKIVITLQDKVTKGTPIGNLDSEADALEALRALGYSPKEARDALQEVPREITDVGERVRAALGLLGK